MQHLRDNGLSEFLRDWSVRPIRQNQNQYRYQRPADGQPDGLDLRLLARFGRGQPGDLPLLRVLLGQFPYPAVLDDPVSQLVGIGAALPEPAMSHCDGGAVPADLISTNSP